jgi:hypothetical protein
MKKPCEKPDAITEVHGKKSGLPPMATAPNFANR